MFQLVHRYPDIGLRSILILMLLVSFNSLRAEEDSLKLINNLRCELKAQYGFVYPHHASIREVLNKNLPGVELSFTTDSYGRSSWDQIYRYPRYGAGYLFTSLGNDDVYGHAHALFLSLDVPFSTGEEKLRVSYQLCLGMCYIDKVYDPQENPLNLSISSHINAYGSVRFNASYQLRSNSELYLGLCFSHFSNGKVSSPNYGLNTITTQAGLKVNLFSPRYKRLITGTDTWAPSHQILVMLSGGIKSDDQMSERYYPLSTLALDYAYTLSRRYSAFGGFDVFYDATLGPNLEEELERPASAEDYYQAGLHAGVAARYHKFQLCLSMGRYLYATFTKYSKYYVRIGLRYDIAPKFFLNLSLKSHGFTADYIEWGVGYRLKFEK